MQEDLKIFFGRIMEDNKHRILRICSVYAGDPEDRKDLFQDVALNIWKALPSFRKEAGVDTWIYRICLNVCMQHALKLKRTKQNTIDIHGIKISDDCDIHNNIENVERIEKLYSCIAQLN